MSACSIKPIKRVLMTVDAVGGVWTYAMQLAREYRKKNIEIILALMGPSPDLSQREVLKKLDNVEMFKSRYKLEWMDNPWVDVDEAGEWLLELEIITHPDIIHLNGYTHAVFPWHAPVVVVAHSCVCSWYENVKRSDIPESFREYKKRVCEGLASADCVVSPSKSMLQSLFKNYHQVAPSTVIYNGIKMNLLTDAQKEPFILTCGRIWDEGKNINALEEIASGLSWPVYAAGESVKGAIDSVNFKLLGKLDSEHLADLMVKASLFVLPARYEPFGLSILEAAIAGCVLILGNIPSLREIWGDAAIYVNPDDFNEIKNTINECIRVSSMRNEYAQRAIRKAQEYTSCKMADSYLRVYQTLITRKASIENELKFNSQLF